MPITSNPLTLTARLRVLQVYGTLLGIGVRAHQGTASDSLYVTMAGKYRLLGYVLARRMIPMRCEVHARYCQGDGMAGDCVAGVGEFQGYQEWYAIHVIIIPSI